MIVVCLIICVSFHNNWINPLKLRNPYWEIFAEQNVKLIDLFSCKCTKKRKRARCMRDVDILSLVKLSNKLLNWCKFIRIVIYKLRQIWTINKFQFYIFVLNIYCRREFISDKSSRDSSPSLNYLLLFRIARRSVRDINYIVLLQIRVKWDQTTITVSIWRVYAVHWLLSPALPTRL